MADEKPLDGKDQSIRKRYESLATEREPYLKRAREASELTLPYVMPPAGYNGSTDLPTPFQSVGSEGVNTLAGKLLLALLPPGTSFFRLSIDDFVLDELTKKTGGDPQSDMRGKFEAALGKVEKAVVNRLEQTGIRSTGFEALKHLLITGNVLVQVLEKGRTRLHKLDRYVVKRDPSGNVLEIITKESVAKVALPEEIRKIAEDPELEPDEKGKKDQTTVDVYTRVWREPGKWRIVQEVRGKEVPDSTGTYPLDKSPWIALRYTRIDGEDYGRGRVEEYIGDMQSHEALSQALVEGAAIAAKNVALVQPGGQTDIDELTKARNGEAIEGNVNEIGWLRVDKANDLSVAASTAEKIEERLRRAFMITQTRDAERVTAEEVRAVINELEATLGGVYAILAGELQLPLVNRIMLLMTQEKKLPPLPVETVSPSIITGLDALGRNADYQKLRAFVQDVGTELGVDTVKEYINIGDYLRNKAASLQLNEKLIRSEEEVQAARSQAQQQAMMAKVAGPAMQAMKGADSPQPQA